MLASEVMDRAAVLLNDANKTTYTYAVQLPFLKLALDELEEEMSVIGLPVTKEITSTPQSVASGATELDPPADLVEPKILKERKAGTSDRWIPMTFRDWEPDVTPMNELRFWTWRENKFKFPAATQDNEVQISYVKKLADIASENSEIGILNSRSFLAYRTASFVAEHIKKMPEEANSHKENAYRRIGVVLTSGTRTRQNSRIRRKPYRVGRR